MKSRYKKVGHWDNGFFVEDKPIRPWGRLAQMNKTRKKKTDSETVALWKRLDNEA